MIARPLVGDVTNPSMAPAGIPLSPREYGANSRAGARSGTCSARTTENAASPVRQSKAVQRMLNRSDSRKTLGCFLKRILAVYVCRDESVRPDPRTLRIPGGYEDLGEWGTGPLVMNREPPATCSSASGTCSATGTRGFINFIEAAYIMPANKAQST